MLRKNRIASKSLQRLWEKGDQRRIPPESAPKIKRILSALNAIVHPTEMNLPGYKFHELRGDRKGTFSLMVTGNWRITFKWDNEGPYDVTLEDYHGK